MRTIDWNAEVNEGTRRHQPPLCTRHAATTAGWARLAAWICTWTALCAAVLARCHQTPVGLPSCSWLPQLWCRLALSTQPIPRINYQFSSSASQDLWNESMKPPNKIMYYGFAQRPFVRYSEHWKTWITTILTAKQTQLGSKHPKCWHRLAWTHGPNLSWECVFSRHANPNGAQTRSRVSKLRHSVAIWHYFSHLSRYVAVPL